MRAAALALVALGCGVPVPEGLPRVEGAEPAGDAVPPEDVVAAVAFTAPVLAADALGGRIVLAPAAALRDVVETVEAEALSGPPPGAVAADAALEEGGRRVTLRPRAPLAPLTEHVVVVSTRLRAEDGRAVLDPDGRRRPFVHAFGTGMASGPPPRPVLTEVRADAETPEAGGEYVEVLNDGEGPLELAGLRLVKRTATGTGTCTIAAAAGGRVPVGGLALVAGGAWDDRYDVPAGVPRYACGATALLGGLANDRAPAVSLELPGGTALSTFGVEEPAPRCAAAAERIDPRGPDAAWNLACAEEEGTPGACNSVTAPWDC